MTVYEMTQALLVAMARYFDKGSIVTDEGNSLLNALANVIFASKDSFSPMALKERQQQRVCSAILFLQRKAGQRPQLMETQIDGQGNIISGLIMRRTGETGVGLVNVGTSNLEIHDLTLDATCTFTGYRYVGGFAGKVNGEKGGRVFFTNLGFEGTVNVNDNGGGIVGCIPNNDFTAHFTNCYTVGTVNGVSDNGALSGWSSYARIRNCYALVKGKGWESGHDVCRGFTPHFTNSYACGAKQTGSGLGNFTESEMTNGTLLSLLWQGTYHQEPGTDTHPLLSHPSSSNSQTPTAIQSPSTGNDSTRPLYDLSGRPVTIGAGQRGIFIRDGKKLVITR